MVDERRHTISNRNRNDRLTYSPIINKKKKSCIKDFQENFNITRRYIVLGPSDCFSNLLKVTKHSDNAIALISTSFVKEYLNFDKVFLDDSSSSSSNVEFKHSQFFNQTMSKLIQTLHQGSSMLIMTSPSNHSFFNDKHQIDRDYYFIGSKQKPGLIIRLFKHLTNRDLTFDKQLVNCIKTCQSNYIYPNSSTQNQSYSKFILDISKLEKYVANNELKMLNSSKRCFEIPFFSLFTYNSSDGTFEDLLALDDDFENERFFQCLPMIDFESSINKCRNALANRTSNEVFIHISIVNLTYQDCFMLLNKYSYNNHNINNNDDDDDTQNSLNTNLFECETTDFKFINSKDNSFNKFDSKFRNNMVFITESKIHNLLMVSASLQVASEINKAFCNDFSKENITNQLDTITQRFVMLKKSTLQLKNILRTSIIGIINPSLESNDSSPQYLMQIINMFNFISSKKLDWYFTADKTKVNQQSKSSLHNKILSKSKTHNLIHDKDYLSTLEYQSTLNHKHSIKYDNQIMEQENHHFNYLQSDIKAKKLLDVDIKKNLKIFEHSLPDNEEMINWQPFNESKLDNLIDELKLRLKSTESLYSDWKFNSNAILQDLSSCVDLASNLEKDNNQLEIELQVANDFKSNLEERISALRSESLELRNEYTRLENVYKRKAYDELQGVRNELQGEYTLRRRRLRNLLHSQNQRIALLRELADTNDDKEINHLISQTNNTNKDQ